jgi:predicted PurR-regulated permease PerM
MQRIWPAPLRYIVLAVLLILLAALIWYVRSLLQPLLAAGVIAYVLSPAAGFLMARFGLSRRAAATLVYFLMLAAILILVGTLAPVIMDQLQSIRTELEAALLDLQRQLATPVQFGLLRLDLRLLVPALTALINRGSFMPQPSQALRFIEMTSRGVAWTVVILVIVYYLMTEWDDLRKWVIELAPPSEQGDMRRLYLQIHQVWAQYLRGQLRLIFILGVIYATAWQIIGLPGALALGFLAGLLNLVPEVGPAAIGLLATVIAYLEGSQAFPAVSPLWFAVLTLGVYLLINAFKSVWLQPRILGRSVLLHEGLVFVAIIAALFLNGILGVLVVVPVLASAIIVEKYLRRRLLGLPPFDEERSEALPSASPAAARGPEPAILNTGETGLKAAPLPKKKTE